MNKPFARELLIVGLVVLAALAGRPLSAQTTPPAPRPAAPAPRQAPPAGRPGDVQTDPIRCWWKTDRTAVRVGERFALVLTCGVIEAGRITVVPNIAELEGGALQITPFEVVSATRRDDITDGPWRYLQFEYDIRLLNDGFFGKDVNIPALTVTYNLRSTDDETQGRDLSYVLPALPVRILSLVPANAADIRDESSQTFGDIESRRFQSLAAMVAAGIAFVFAAVFAVLAALRLAGQYRTRTAAVVRPVPAGTVLRTCLRALRDLQSEVARGGWTPQQARRALTALRIAGAAGLGRDVAQSRVDGQTSERDGQLAVRTGWTRRGRTMVSAPTTSMAIAASLRNGHAPGARTRASLEQIGGSLHVLSAVGYGRGQAPDSAVLDSALGEGIEAVQRLRVGTLWPVRTMAAVTKAIGM